jgi:hypothetical protein
LRQFVEPEAAQEFSDPGVVIAMSIRLAIAVERRLQGPKFVQQKASAVATNTLLPEDDGCAPRSTKTKTDTNRNNRRKNYNREKRDNENRT